MRHPISLLKKALLALLIGGASLELVLQAGALVVAWTHRDLPMPPDDRPCVLCVGDSYTFGVGASDPSHSYPAQLEKALRQKGIEIATRNAGLPGQHSRDVLQRIAGQLSESTRVVCVLVGTNDTWRRPQVLSAEEARRTALEARPAQSFQLQWRTGKLLQLATRFRWFSWLRRAPPEDEAAVIQMDLGYKLAAREFGFETLPNPPARAQDALAPNERLLGSVHQSMAAGNYDSALAAAETLRAESPSSPRVLALAATAAARAGRGELSASIVTELEQLDLTQASESTGEALCETYANTGRPEAMLRRGRMHVAAFPQSVEGWHGLQRACFELGLDTEALQAMRTAFRLMGRAQPLRTGHMLRNYARLIHKDKPNDAARILVAAHLIDGDAPATRVVLPIVAHALPRKAITSELDALRLPDVARSSSLRALLTEQPDQSTWQPVLAAHLESIAALAATHRAKAVFAAYPFHNPDLESVIQSTATKLSIPFVNLRIPFEKELRTCEWSDLFVSDGHCNDRGYELVAEEMANALISILRR